MAQQQIQPAEETLFHLNRLSQKPGVQSTLILSRETGAIVRASGLLVTETSPTDSSDPTSPSDGREAAGDASGENASMKKVNGAAGGVAKKGNEEEGKLKSAEEVARSVWGFFSAAGNLVSEMKGEYDDEVKLVRLRMRRSELVVVPDAKFLLVVVHDTPAA